MIWPQYFGTLNFFQYFFHICSISSLRKWIRSSLPSTAIFPWWSHHPSSGAGLTPKDGFSGEAQKVKKNGGFTLDLLECTTSFGNFQWENDDL